MDDTVNMTVTEARRNFSKMIAQVECGHEITLTHQGSEVAKVVPFIENPRRSGREIAAWILENPVPPTALSSRDYRIQEYSNSWE